MHPPGARCRAPSTISSPVPAVDAATGSLRLRPRRPAPARGPGHLDHRRAPVEPPGGLHRVAERPGDRGRAVRPAERVEGALAAVGHRHLVAVPPGCDGGARRSPRPPRRRSRCRGACREPRRHVAARSIWPHRCPPLPAMPASLPMAVATVAPMAPLVRPADRPRVQPGPGVVRDRDDDGALVSQAGRGRAGVRASARSSRAATSTWIAAAMSDGDRGGGRRAWSRPRASASGCSPSTPRPTGSPTTWCATRCSGSRTTGCGTSPASPPSTRRWRDGLGRLPAVNQAFADAVAEVAPEGATVLVQDYHLCLVAARLRDRRPDLRVRALQPHAVRPARCGSAPCPTPRRRSCSRAWPPTAPAASTRQRWADDFAASRTRARRPRAADVRRRRSPPTRTTSGRRPRRPSAPRRWPRSRRRVGDRAVIGRVDRIELSKNILRGFLAFDVLLEAHPEHRGRVVFVAVAYPSRAGVPATPPTASEIERGRRARSTTGGAPTTGSRSCSTSRTTTRGRSRCCAGPTCCW